MKKITRGDLANIISEKTTTRTTYNRADQKGVDITDKWIVVFMEIDAITGMFDIYVEAPDKIIDEPNINRNEQINISVVLDEDEW